MNLGEIRTQFARESGRFDLVDQSSTPFGDEGADYYIRAGQRTLDNKLPTPKSLAEEEFSISAGDYSVESSMIQAVKGVWIREGSNEPEELSKLDLRRFYEEHGDDGYLKQAERAKPESYSIGVIRDGSADPAKQENKAILLGPPADGDYTLIVVSTYFSTDLKKDDDESYWSIKYPHLLVIAARYMMEVSHRNTSGQQDFLRYIEREVSQIDDNVVEEMISNRDQLTDEREIFEGIIRKGGPFGRKV